jgi:lipopolysaccharide transport system permease protein
VDASLQKSENDLGLVNPLDLSATTTPSDSTGSAQLPALPTVTVITAHRGWFDWRLQQLWRYRDLISLFVWRDFVSVYKQTILGPAWHIIRPLFTTVIFTVVFGRIAGMSTDGAPQFLFYMVGNVAWTYFATSLDNTAKTFVSNSALLGKVYFHRMVIPISLVISNLIAFGIQLGILLIVMAGYVVSGHALHVTAWALLMPLLLLILAGYSLGGGIIVCAMTTRYRDLSYLVTFGIQSFMYITPVIFPVSSVPERYRWLANVNPLTPVFEGFRLGLLGVGTVTVQQIASTFVVMLVVLAGGMMLFTRVERTFMDTV